MNKNHWVILIITFIFLILIDQFSKSFAQEIPNYQRWGYFNFNLKYNSGVFLGFFNDLPPIIRMVGISTLGIFLFFIYATIQYFLVGKFLLFRHGINLIIAGIFGNLIDRIIKGHIIDFLAFGKGRYKTPVFNFADIFLWIGILIVAYIVIFDSKDLMPDQSKRKKYIINKKFQYKHTFTFVLISLAFCLMNLVLVFTFFNYAIDESLAMDVAPIFKSYLIIFSIFSILFLALIFFIGIITSNRVAGPIYALRRFLNEFKNGKIKELKLREGDDFKELEDISRDILRLLSDRQ